jgi:hypothetical protein
MNITNMCPLFTSMFLELYCGIEDTSYATETLSFLKDVTPRFYSKLPYILLSVLRLKCFRQLNSQKCRTKTEEKD